MMRPVRLGADPRAPFPPVAQALERPNGLLAWGGDLHPERLLRAYRHGIFPWYSPGEPLLWWSPDPRMLIPTDRLHLSRRFRRSLRDSDAVVVADRDFDMVVAACAAPRADHAGTWISAEMAAAYAQLHQLGHAHSIEVRGDGGAGELLGGLYGIAIGRMFFGESMFSGIDGGSKIAIAALCRVLAGWGWPWLDGQVESGHLRRLGGITMPRREFVEELDRLCALPGEPGGWARRFPPTAARDLAQDGPHRGGLRQR